MTAIEIARNLAELGQEKDACAAYVLSLQNEKAEPLEKMEAACYLLRFGDDYKIPYTIFISLYSENCFQDEILDILTQAFYEPNEEKLQKRYKANCKLLEKYPYLFRKDFPAFESLPVRFFPYDDKGGYLPFFVAEKRFAPFVNIKNSVITRYFFRDLENPVLTDDLYSQYELEYLVDNVRNSEYVARENHIYLHYTDWKTFCSWLQVIDFRRLLKEKKIVFLMEEEISQYPIDFKARFGIDYSQYPLRRIGIRDVKRLIWHAQLSSSNGGDFFNEVFDAHPNLYYTTSLLYDDMLDVIKKVRERLRTSPNADVAQKKFQHWNAPQLVRDLYNLKNRTDTDILLALLIHDENIANTLDAHSRIVPAVFLQPHFRHVDATINVTKKGDAVLDTNVYDIIHSSPFLNGFPYVKTFIPMRRFTTSYGSTLRFMESQFPESYELQESQTPEKEAPVIPDLQLARILTRTYLQNPEDRLFHDCVIVRFEDGKLNPEATFSRLAAFLDIPYTESMTYCSQNNVRDVQTEKGNAIGFDPATVYRTYDEYLTESDRLFIEYFMRDAYQYYGYDFQCYDGSPVDNERVQEWMSHFDRLDEDMRKSWHYLFRVRANDLVKEGKIKEGEQDAMAEALLDKLLQKRDENRRFVTETLQRSLFFVNKRGQPLKMTPMLQPDPALLVQPLYH